MLNTVLFYQFSSVFGVGKFGLPWFLCPPILDKWFRSPVGIYWSGHRSFCWDVFSYVRFSFIFKIIVLISGLFNDTDFHLFVIIYHYSVVSRLEDYLGKNIVYSTTTFLTSYTDVSREGYGRSHRTTYLDFLNYVVS